MLEGAHLASGGMGGVLEQYHPHRIYINRKKLNQIKNNNDNRARWVYPRGSGVGMRVGVMGDKAETFVEQGRERPSHSIPNNLI